MVIYRPGRLPLGRVARFEGGYLDGTTMPLSQWPPREEFAVPADVADGSYRLASYTDAPPLEALYRWEPSA